MARVLVIRFSAFGDVAMAIPAIYSLAKAYPHEDFIFITKSPFDRLFINKPLNIKVIPFDTSYQNKGIRGTYSFIKAIEEKYPIDKVADLHNVLRSEQIDIYYRLRGKKVAVIDKGRREKKNLTRKLNKKKNPLESSVSRYCRVFQKLGYIIPLDFSSLFEDRKTEDSFSFPTPKADEIWIGIAPFAQHTGKIYPLDKMHQVIDQLASIDNIRLFLFGGKNEKERLEQWESEYGNVQSVAGRMVLEEELNLISQLNVMVSMDSANMHLASLVNTPVISIWGATHPYAGFYGYRQDPRNIIQVDLPCRPCSVFGNKHCYRGDFACMIHITPELIVEKVREVIMKKYL